MAQVRRAVGVLEAETGLRLGDPGAPLLLSVRSGARFSMPGMMDTVLNLGLTPGTRAGAGEDVILVRPQTSPDDLHGLVAARGTLDDEGKKLLDAAVVWHEDNPMLGIRGVRLGLLRPGLYDMQVRALLDAAVELATSGGDPHVRVMIPLVSSLGELQLALAHVRSVVEATMRSSGIDLRVQVGAMIETPRAAVLAGTLAPTVDFLSFGTNDLTQMTFGFSRDDVEARLMPLYLDRKLLPADPFQTLDVEGVGRLVADAVTAARAAAPVEIGVCGEHGGDPPSIRFFQTAGFDEVSCSPHRVPTARLAAAHAALGR